MSSYSFSYNEIGHLTRLGWLAKVPLSPGKIEVFHGSFVECNEEWFVEGCWDGGVQRGDFDQSSYFFGSGVRLRNDGIHVVASRATVDNIHYCQNKTGIIISNSMLLLLSAIGARLNPKYCYEEEFSGALRGIQHYKKDIPILHHSISEIFQVYFGNLCIKNGNIFIELPSCSVHFVSYSQYYTFLTDKIKEIHSNASSPARQHPMTCYTTLSTGYDSSAVSVLASKHCGVDTCITSKLSDDGSRFLEDARPIAKKLGMKAIFLDPDDSGLGNRSLLYYSANPHHFEMIFDKATRLFEAQNRPVLLFTGYHGDKVWDKNLRSEYLSSHICRGDTSGKGLSEIRLKTGFINAAIPFLGARKISQIYAISTSSEMAPWSIGGDYDRPIPRRICEGAGLDRDSFGQKKYGIATHKGRPSDRTLRACFTRDLKSEFGIGWERLLLFDTLDFLSYHVRDTKYFDFLSQCKRFFIFGQPNLRLFLFIWAVNRIVESTNREVWDSLSE